MTCSGIFARFQRIRFVIWAPVSAVNDIGRLSLDSAGSVRSVVVHVSPKSRVGEAYYINTLGSYISLNPLTYRILFPS